VFNASFSKRHIFIPACYGLAARCATRGIYQQPLPSPVMADSDFPQVTSSAPVKQVGSLDVVLPAVGWTIANGSTLLTTSDAGQTWTQMSLGSFCYHIRLTSARVPPPGRRPRERRHTHSCLARTVCSDATASRRDGGGTQAATLSGDSRSREPVTAWARPARHKM